MVKTYGKQINIKYFIPLLLKKIITRRHTLCQEEETTSEREPPDAGRGATT